MNEASSSVSLALTSPGGGIFQETLFDDGSLPVSQSGVLAPGTYRLQADAIRAAPLLALG